MSTYTIVVRGGIRDLQDLVAAAIQGDVVELETGQGYATFRLGMELGRITFTHIPKQEEGHAPADSDLRLTPGL